MRCGVSSDKVKNVIIWGNHSSTQYPDVHHAKVNLSGSEMDVYNAVKDDAWLKGEFISVSVWQSEREAAFSFLWLFLLVVSLLSLNIVLFILLLQTVQQRGAAVIKARKLSSAMSAAKAICDHMRDIWFGTKEVSVDKEETAPRASGRSDKANVDWGEKI